MDKGKLKNIGIYYNPKHFGTLKPLREKLEILSKNGFEIFMLTEQTDSILENIKSVSKFKTGKIDLVITFGGDGTMLNVLNKVLKENIPVLGFNHGKVGFLSECEKGEFSDAIKRLLQQDFRIEQRSVLECTFKNKKHYAINDLEINRGKSSHIIGIKVLLDGILLYRIDGDGVVVATPTGSTAYSLSAGGAILHPQAKSFIITPNNPQSQFSKPVVISNHKKVILKFVKGKHGSLLNIDGINIGQLDEGDELYLKKSNYTSKFIKLPGKNFCKIVRQKFNFGECK